MVSSGKHVLRIHSLYILLILFISVNNIAIVLIIENKYCVTKICTDFIFNRYFPIFPVFTTLGKSGRHFRDLEGPQKNGDNGR
jgi:hypothetical protein